MYNANNWERATGIKTYTSRKCVYPGDPEWENPDLLRRTKPSDYADFGFKNSPI